MGANGSICAALREMERVRSELYNVVEDRNGNLNSEEICAVSERLDNLIVKYMCAIRWDKPTKRK